MRAVTGGAAVLAFCFMFIFFGPLEMVAFGSDSFMYSYKNIFVPIALTAFFAFALGTLLISQLKGKIFDWAVCLVFAFTVCGYLQAAFMNGSFGTLTGDKISWSEHSGELILNTVFWVAVTVALFLIMRFNKKFWEKLVTFVSVLLVIMQFVPTVAIFAGFYEQTKITKLSTYMFSKKGMYELSAEDNVIVIVLDRLDYDYIQKVLNEDPEFFDRLDGFTSYTNAISVYARTRPALAQLLTGFEGTAYNTAPDDYFIDAWASGENNILTAASEKGYSTELYTSIKYVFGDTEYTDYVSNAKYIDKNTLVYSPLISKLLNLSAYRYMPDVAKSLFWADTNYYNSEIFVNDKSPYTFSDSEYAPYFSESTAERESGSFKLYHFSGSHTPYHMNADGTESEEETTVTEQTMGCFNILFSFFDRMKELGVYKDSTIIITGDHGASIDDTVPLTKATRIGLFYKPSGSEGTPLTQSKAQVCTDNIPATILKSIGASYDGYCPPLDEIGEDDEIERFYYKSVADDKTFHEIELYKYRVVGDAAYFKNWELVDVTEIEPGNGFH